jgi:hypothetical protein
MLGIYCDSVAYNISDQLFNKIAFYVEYKIAQWSVEINLEGV